MKRRKGAAVIVFALSVALCACSANTHNDVIDESDTSRESYDSNTEMLQSGWELLDMEVFRDTASLTNEIHFLLAEEISMEGQIYKTGVDDTNLLLELFQNLQVKEVTDFISYADYYLLFRDENDAAICLIEVWDGYICINHSNFYEVAGNELFLTIDRMIRECEELSKVSAEEILIAYTNDYSYGKFTKEDIVLYKEQLAILVESGYESNDSKEEYYYEKFIYWDGLYFDKDYQTTYMLSQCKTYYYEDGSVQDTYSDRVAYYDYFSGERMQFMY